MYLNKQVRLPICTQTLSYVILFASIILIQPIFDQSFNEANCFAKWFALIAIVSALSGLMNARFVIRIGMRTMVLFSLLGQMVAGACVLIYFVRGPSSDTILSFVVYIIWQKGVLFSGRVYSWQSECFGIAAYGAQCRFCRKRNGWHFHSGLCNFDKYNQQVV